VFSERGVDQTAGELNLGRAVSLFLSRSLLADDKVSILLYFVSAEKFTDISE
jgi:hypothetical protein